MLHVDLHITAVAVTGFTVTNSGQQLIYICSYPHSRQCRSTNPVLTNMTDVTDTCVCTCAAKADILLDSFCHYTLHP